MPSFEGNKNLLGRRYELKRTGHAEPISGDPTEKRHIPLLDWLSHLLLGLWKVSQGSREGDIKPEPMRCFGWKRDQQPSVQLLEYLKVALVLGPPVVPFYREGSPTKIGCRKKLVPLF